MAIKISTLLEVVSKAQLQLGNISSMTDVMVVSLSVELSTGGGAGGSGTGRVLRL